MRRYTHRENRRMLDEERDRQAKDEHEDRGPGDYEIIIPIRKGATVCYWDTEAREVLPGGESADTEGRQVEPVNGFDLKKIGGKWTTYNPRRVASGEEIPDAADVAEFFEDRDSDDSSGDESAEPDSGANAE